MISKTIQSGDWKGEKHVPHISVCEEALKENKILATAKVGEEISHPNTFEHHIAWIKVFFQPKDAKFPVEIGSYTASAHGESEIFTDPCVKVCIPKQSGTLYSLSYCNIHGLWEASLDIE